MDKLAILNNEEINNYLRMEKKTILDNVKNNIVNTDFYKVFIYEKILNGNLCDFIINETEEYSKKIGGWTHRRHLNYPTTDIPVKGVKNINILVHNFVIYNIFPLIEKYYNLSIYHLNIVDLFIVKYEYDKQAELETHVDGNLISFNILLNSEFEGGGTIIKFNNENEKLYSIGKGDILLHCGKIRHSGNKITSGKRYILVGFINYLLYHGN